MSDKTSKARKSFSRDDKASLTHALQHLLANKIAQEVCHHSGWYIGNREQFVARHKKAIAFMRALLSQNEARSAAGSAQT